MELESSLSPCMYAVVCSHSTRKKWSRAFEEILRKYEKKWPGGVQEVTYEDCDLFSALPALAELKPTYTCFLAHHSECSKKFVQQVHKLTREIDTTTPYTDTIWGILTGISEEDCLRMLKQQPLMISIVVGNCPIPLEKFTSGVSFSEMEQKVSWRKVKEGSVTIKPCPPDVTESLLVEIGASRFDDKGVDMVITSGHATESELNLGYCFESGQIRCSDGQILGHALDGTRHKLILQDSAPKVLSAAGNCLMAHIQDKDSMALAWLHSAGVTQMVGYVVPTWYGYAGWGVHKYFINNPGRMTFAEAYFANQQSLLAKLNAFVTPKAAIKSHEDVYKEKFGQAHDNLVAHDLSGLTYDEDTTVFYGDPAWEARLLPDVEQWDFSVNVTKCSPVGESEREHWTQWVFTVETLRPGRWDCPIADDKTTCPGRPPIYVFPYRVTKVKLITGRAIVTCNFVLMTAEGAFDAGEVHTVQFATLV